MEHKVLYDTLPFLKTADPKKQKQFEEYFKNAPIWIFESMQVYEVDKNVIILREHDPADTIYFVGKGIIEAIDYRVYGITYEFMWFDRLYAMGGMEYIMDLDTYRTTIRTVTKCTIIKIPRQMFSKWMKMDLNALKQESKLMGQYLLEQGRTSRAFLFLQGANRLAMLFTDRYERYARKDTLLVEGSYQDLSNATGLSIKTITRSIKKFTDTGLVTKSGNNIYINHEQYVKMKELVTSVMDSE